MALPEGIETCTVTSGVPVTFGGAPVKAFVSVEPSVYLVHTATGTPLVDFLEELSVTEGVAAQFTLPVDQDGFQDENGNAYRGWYYTARITYSTTSKAKNKTPKVKVFQLVSGQTLVDLDTLPGGVAALPYTAPLAAVTSVNGQTGAVLVDAEPLPTRLEEAALNATILDQVGVVRGLGSADDSVLINAALANLREAVIQTGAVANLPTTVTIPAGKTLRVEAGATLTRTGAGGGQAVVVQAGGTLKGAGTIDGAGKTTFVVSVAGAGATIDGVTIKGAGSYGIGGGAWADLRVQGCNFTGLGSYALLLEGAAARASVRGNRINASAQGIMFKDGPTDGVIANNMLVLTAGVGIEVFGAASKRVSVTGNTIGGTPGIGISIAAANGCAITGNVVSGHSQIGIENAEGASFTAISGNTVNPSAVATGVGISVTTSNQATKPTREVSVTGNTVQGQALTGIQTEYGRNVSITGNTVSDSKGRGIWLNNSPVGASVRNNTVVFTDASGGAVGIQIAGTNTLAAGNYVDYSPLTGVGKAGIMVEGGTGHTVIGNIIREASTGIEVNNSAGTVLDGNRTIDTTTNAVNLYNAGSAQAIVLTHISKVATGGTIANSGGATLTGPLVTVT